MVYYFNKQKYKITIYLLLLLGSWTSKEALDCGTNFGLCLLVLGKQETEDNVGKTACESKKNMIS